MQKRIALILALGLMVLAVCPAMGEDALLSGEGIFSFGSVNGDVYESDFLGYGCVLEGWAFADEEDIAALNQISGDLLSEDVQKLIQEADTIIDMSGESEDGFLNMNIQFQKIDGLGDFSDLDVLVDLSISQLAPMLEGMGYTDSAIEKTTVDLDGDSVPGIYIVGEMYGVQIFQKEAVVGCGDLVAFITVTSIMDDRTDEVFANFYRLAD